MDKLVTRVSAVLADPMRFRIFREIAESGELCCGDLAKRFPIAQATVSHHLKVLSDAGLIDVRHQGQFNFFRAVPGGLKPFLSSLAGLGPRARRARKHGTGEVATA